MKNIIKNRLKTIVLSVTLVLTSMTAYNAININNYTNLYQNSKEAKATWIENISDKDKINDMYKNYQYSDSDYKKDQAFFNEVFKRDITLISFDNETKIKNARFENVDDSIVSYFKVYDRYRADINTVLKQKELNRLWDKGELSKEKYSEQYLNNIQSLYSTVNEKVFGSVLYTANFEIETYSTENIRTFNQLFETEKLPPFIFSIEKFKIHKKKSFENYKRGDYKIYKNFLDQENATFIAFLDKYQRGELTEKEKHSFFKILSFINYTMHDKYNEQKALVSYNMKLKSNLFYIGSLDILNEQTKIYEQINDNIAEKHNIYGTSRENLDSPY